MISCYICLALACIDTAIATLWHMLSDLMSARSDLSLFQARCVQFRSDPWLQRQLDRLKLLEEMPCPGLQQTSKRRCQPLMAPC